YCSKGCLSGACIAGSWTVDTMPNKPGSVSDFNARMVLDAASRPHLALYGNSALVYREKGATGWTEIPVDNGLGARCYRAIALSPSGAPLIAYYDGINRNLRFAELKGGTFTISLVTTTGDQGMAPSLTVDPSGNPVVGFLDATSTWKYRVATRVGTTWS